MKPSPPARYKPRTPFDKKLKHAIEVTLRSYGLDDTDSVSLIADECAGACLMTFDAIKSILSPVQEDETGPEDWEMEFDRLAQTNEVDLLGSSEPLKKLVYSLLNARDERIVEIVKKLKKHNFEEFVRNMGLKPDKWTKHTQEIYDEFNKQIDFIIEQITTPLDVTSLEK